MAGADAGAVRQVTREPISTRFTIWPAACWSNANRTTTPTTARLPRSLRASRRRRTSATSCSNGSKNPILPEISDEDREKMRAFDLDELASRFRELLEEQKERHDGGNRWIGTGGTSPFGHGGEHPTGVRVGGAGGGRSAVQVADSQAISQPALATAFSTRGRSASRCAA